MDAGLKAEDPDRKMEIAIGQMLRYGVVGSGVVVAAGGVLYLGRSYGAVTRYATFHATAPALRTVAGVLHGVRALDPESLIQLGILLLIATPVARVVFCLVGFMVQRDRVYVAISLLVLAILTYSLVHGVS